MFKKKTKDIKYIFEARFVFKPRKNITTYELSQIVKLGFQGKGGIHALQDYPNLPRHLKKHFQLMTEREFHEAWNQRYLK